MGVCRVRDREFGGDDESAAGCVSIEVGMTHPSPPRPASSTAALGGALFQLLLRALSPTPLLVMKREICRLYEKGAGSSVEHA